MNAIRRNVRTIAIVMLAFTVGGIIAARVLRPDPQAQATLWVGDAGSASSGAKVDANVQLIRGTALAMAVVRSEALYLRTGSEQDFDRLRDVALASRFMKGDYSFTVDHGAGSWTLSLIDSRMTDTGAVGAAVGEKFGLVWHPSDAALARFPDDAMDFRMITPNEASYELRRRLVTQLGPDAHVLRVALSDDTQWRAVRTLDAVARTYVAMAPSMGLSARVLDAATPLPRRSGLSIVLLAVVAGALVSALIVAMSPRRVREDEYEGALGMHG